MTNLLIGCVHGIDDLSRLVKAIKTKVLYFAMESPSTSLPNIFREEIESSGAYLYAGRLLVLQTIDETLLRAEEVVREEIGRRQ